MPGVDQGRCLHILTDRRRICKVTIDRVMYRDSRLRGLNDSLHFVRPLVRHSAAAPFTSPVQSASQSVRFCLMMMKGSLDGWMDGRVDGAGVGVSHPASPNVPILFCHGWMNIWVGTLAQWLSFSSLALCSSGCQSVHRCSFTSPFRSASQSVSFCLLMIEV